MTSTEFNDWLEGFFAAFPRIGEWLGKLGNSGAILKLWRDTLASADVNDAVEVTRRMMRNQEGYQAPENNRGERTWSFVEGEIPVYVAKWCERVKLGRIVDSSPRELDRLPNPIAAVKLTAICKEAERRAAQGENPHALSVELCPVDANDMRNYRCLLCLDRGLVQCWTAYSMRLAALGKLTLNGGIYSTMVRCSCYAGNQYEEFSYKDSTKKNGRRETPVIYNPEQWVTFEHFDENGDRQRGNSQAGIDRLNLFMARYVPSNGVTELAY